MVTVKYTTKEGPHIGVVIYKPGEECMVNLKTGWLAEARSFREVARGFREVARGFRKDADFERFAQKTDNALPRFSYAGPRLHHDNNTILLGDTIHAVKPYFGQDNNTILLVDTIHAVKPYFRQGVNSAFEDVAVLEQALEAGGVNSAFEDVAVLEQALEAGGDKVKSSVKKFSALRAKDAEALVELSYTLDGGFLKFVLPLILDSTLNRFLPAVFSPNIIASFQNEAWSFSQIRVRKRLDRALQVLLLGAFAFMLVKVVQFIGAMAVKMASMLLGGVAA
eukprot:gene11765-8954_t